MRYTLTNILFLAGLAAFPALAAEQQMTKHEAMQAMSQGAAHVMPMSEGIAKKLDAKKGMVTLQHGDIADLMPAMTMSYRVKRPQQLESIQAGDKVRFLLEKYGNDYVVTHIEQQ